MTLDTVLARASKLLNSYHIISIISDTVRKIEDVSRQIGLFPFQMAAKCIQQNYPKVV